MAYAHAPIVHPSVGKRTDQLKSSTEVMRENVQRDAEPYRVSWPMQTFNYVTRPGQDLGSAAHNHPAIYGGFLQNGAAPARAAECTLIIKFWSPRLLCID